MGKSIYLLKIFLLSNVFPLTRTERKRITRLVGYIVHLYFLSASLSVAAPRHDLTFWYDLIAYHHYDREIAQASLASVRRHLWYLCPELVVLALFDDFTTYDEKQMIAVSLVHTSRPDAFATGKPNFDLVAIHLTEDKPSLASFINERSWLLFSLLGSEAGWLYDDPNLWSDNEDYIACKMLCKALPVVNDAAERAVKDVTDCAHMSRDPTHRDNIILVRSEHRAHVPNLSKASLKKV